MNEKENNTTYIMAGTLMILCILAFFIIAGRFIYIETTGEVSGVDLKAYAKQKRTSSQIIPAERGKILDSQGMVLAYDRPVYRVYAILDSSYSENDTALKHVEDAGVTAEKLAPFLDMEEKELEETIKKGQERESFQVEFGVKGRNLTQQQREEIEKAEITGIQFVEEADRFYPNGTFASHILGFAQKDEDGLISGVAGMEDEMDELLAGKNGHISYERDNYNKKLLNPKEIVKKKEDGKDVHLTIDQKIQTLLEDALSHVNKEYEPERIVAVVMNPKTGEIMAMSSRPSYNPNNPKDVVNWYNDAISSPFEAGSTVKMFTWAAAIEAGVYNGDELYPSGKYQPNEKLNEISDHNKGEGWGSISFDEGFVRSSNVAASKLVWEKLGTESYLEYLQAFHFDQKTGIDLPGEVSGKILYDWPQEKLTTAFGQGSTITPIQQMMAATAIANDGKMMKPYVVDKIVDPTNNKVMSETEAEVVGEPISAETADEVLDLLEEVVSGEEGTGKPYNLKDYSVAGKTGTAQLPDGGGAYMKGHSNYVFSFLGMAPKDDPELMMYVAVKQPKLDGDESGSAPVSFIFNNVMENGLHYLDVNPDKEEQKDIEYVVLPKLIDKDPEVLKKELEEKGVLVEVIGDGKKVTDASFDKDERILQHDRLILITNKPKMPDLKGWSLREVHELANLVDLKLETLHQGYVTKQSIEVGNEISAGNYLAVEFEPPKQKKD